MELSEARRLKALEDENARLKRLLADAMLDNAALKKIADKKLVTPDTKPRAVHLIREKLSLASRLQHRQAALPAYLATSACVTWRECRWLLIDDAGLHRST